MGYDFRRSSICVLDNLCYHYCYCSRNSLIMNKKSSSIIFVIISIMGLFVLLYYAINPATSYLMPKCLFKILTGFDCPSCGSQRALHALLNGHIYEAIMFNPFIFLVAPYLLTVIYVTSSKSRLAAVIRPITHSHITIILYLVIYIVWWVVRNTNWWLNI